MHTRCSNVDDDCSASPERPACKGAYNAKADKTALCSPTTICGLVVYCGII